VRRVQQGTTRARPLLDLENICIFGGAFALLLLDPPKRLEERVVTGTEREREREEREREKNLCGEECRTGLVTFG
jgi:hypothetical protein